MKCDDDRTVLEYVRNEPSARTRIKDWIAVYIYVLGCVVVSVSIALTIVFPGGPGIKGFNDFVPEPVVRLMPLSLWGLSTSAGLLFAMAKHCRRRNVIVAIAGLLSSVIWIVLFTIADGLSD